MTGSMTVVLYLPDFAHLGVDVDEFKSQIKEIYCNIFTNIIFKVAPAPSDASGLGGVLSVEAQLTGEKLKSILHELRLLFDNLRKKK